MLTKQMDCQNLSYDNRETCADISTTSSCVPYTGVINDIIKPLDVNCRPNINDIFKRLQEVIQAIKDKLGDNTTLDESCLDFNPSIITQRDLNQKIISELCILKNIISSEEGGIDPETIMLTLDLLCLEDPSCEPQTQYNLLLVINKILTRLCALENRIQIIEEFLNL